MRKVTWPEHLFKPAAAIADPSRAAMLVALMDGLALPAGELARAAGIGAPTASEHLSRLVREGFLVVEPQGRHRYYRLASGEVAAALESMAGLMPRPAIPRRPTDRALCRARLCYHHLAGRLGVQLREALLERAWLRSDGEAYRLGPDGARELVALDLLPDRCPTLSGRQCLDWTERRHHIGGALGRELAVGLIDRVGWLRRCSGSRAVEPTPAGRAALRSVFGLTLDGLGET